MFLDHKKANTFICKDCTAAMAKLRNCEGKPNSKAKNLINGYVYDFCPKRPYIENGEARFLVELYLDCRESKVLPHPGSMMQQTNFTKEVFLFLDEKIARFNNKRHEEALRASKKEG